MVIAVCVAAVTADKEIVKLPVMPPLFPVTV